MNNREQKHRCHVCQMYTASLRIGGDIYICDDCNMIFFYDVKTISDKLQRYAVAKELVLKLKITLRVALGVAKGTRSLQHEVQKKRLKEREASGKSNDAFCVSLRRKGHFNP